MNPEEIKEEMKKRGATMSAVADVLMRSPNTVRKVIHGEAKSRQIARFIAALIERPVDAVWPGQYPERYRRGTPQETKQRLLALRDALLSRQSLSREAA